MGRIGRPPHVAIPDLLRVLRDVRETWGRQFLPGETNEVLLDGLRVFYGPRYAEERARVLASVQTLILQLERGDVVTPATLVPRRNTLKVVRGGRP